MSIIQKIKNWFKKVLKDPLEDSINLPEDLVPVPTPKVNKPRRNRRRNNKSKNK